MPRRFATVTILVLLSASSSAWARKWSDNSGNTVEAKYVRVHNGQVVLLRPGNRILTVPVGNLSADDLEYLRKELEKKGQAHLLPATRPTIGLGASDTNAAETGGEDRLRAPRIRRMWTDTEGKKIRASYIRTDGDSVVLLMDGTEYKVPLSRLSHIDQVYVRAQSMMNRHPSMPTGPSRMPGGLPGPPVGMAGRPGSIVAPQHSTGYDDDSSDYGSGRHSEMAYGSDDDSGDEYESYESEYGSEDEYEEESYASNMSSTPIGSGSPGHPGSGSSAPAYASASSPSSHAPPYSASHMPGPRFPDPPSIPQPPMPVMEEVGECSNCGEEVSAEYGAGDSCPHCGVFFEYEEDELGRKEYAKEGSGSGNIDIPRGGARLVVKVLAFLGAGFAACCGWAIRKVFTS